MKRNKNYYLRKTHRFLGISIGIQFLMWTISGLYFSWTDIDEIHGDHFRKAPPRQEAENLLPIGQTAYSLPVASMEMKFISKEPYYWVNDSILIHAITGKPKREVTKADAHNVAREYIKDDYQITKTELISDVDNHHEYRGRKLPVWAVHFTGEEELITYISAQNGDFQRIRHESWRTFDFLWMFHTMDYEGRDDFNNTLLRAFSLFGLLTITSGFALYFATSPWFIKLTRKSKKSTKPIK